MIRTVENMPTIRQLPVSMVNKIAAGEVIERPASVVKELVENAIDAGATRIDISIDKGGTELVRIADNGCGIAADQLRLALSSHATSKIADTEDLFRIHTFGFRGEALASVAEISQMILRSRAADSSEGAEIRSDGGTFSDIVPCGHPIGTSLEIRNLFFNTPVRRKYLRSNQTELGHVTETFLRLAIGQPQIHFTLKHNDRLIHDLPPTGNPAERIGKLFGRELLRGLIHVESLDGEVAVHGYVGHPNHSRANNRMQYFFLNGRFIKDRALQHALSEAYRGLLTTGRFPIAFLNVSLSPDQFDVNVHPTKLEVRFLDSSKVYSRFLSAIRDRFQTADLKSHPFPRADFPDSLDPVSAMDGDVAEKLRQQVIDWSKNTKTETSYERPARDFSGDSELRMYPLNRERKPDDNRSWDNSRSGRTFESREILREMSSGMMETSSEMETSYGKFPAFETMQTSPAVTKVIQIHRRYLVTETETGLAIIDQHALHERILYEKLKTRMAAGTVESQQLLVPHPVDLLPNEAACVLENRELLAQLGLLLEPFGGSTVLVTGYPAIFPNAEPVELLQTLLTPLLAAGKKPDHNDLLEELMHQMACKAAIKAGDKLRPDVMAELLEMAQAEVTSHHCPHGRPSTLVFTCPELDKMFKRL